MKLLDTLKKNIILEVSEKVKKQLLTRYKEVENVTDDEATIVSYLNDFERYKNDLPADKRDLTKRDFTYAELKSLIDGKRQVKSTGDLFTEFKAKAKERGETLTDTELRILLKKFNEVKSKLPEKFQNPLKFKYLDLVKLINEVYQKLITAVLLEKFKKENPELTEDQVLFYITQYLEIYPEIPFKTKGANQMTFQEFEHLIDGILAKKSPKEREKNADIDSIPTVYKDNNLTIFAPKKKNECITLQHGRSWCTSRLGGGNLYYNYRLGHERTLYYVVDEDLPFDDLNFASVILVDPRGGMALADGSNSGKFSGHQNIPWSDIVAKIPKLDGLQNLLKPEPLTSEEKELIRKYQNVRIDNNSKLNDKLGSDKDVELWMEVNSPRISDFQYENLSSELQKKYIALGFDLSSQQIQSSKPEVLKYYITKKVDSLKTKGLGSLSEQDIALLNTPVLKTLKEDLKSKFAQALTANKSDYLELEFPRSDNAKFVALYGFNELFETANDDVDAIMITNTSDSNMAFEIPAAIGRFKKADSIFFGNFISSLPEEIGECENLSFLSLPDNKNLRTLPWDAINSLPNLGFLNLDKTPNLEYPDDFEKYWNQGEFPTPGFFVKNVIKKN
jgi:hypothetical protein